MRAWALAAGPAMAAVILAAGALYAMWHGNTARARRIETAFGRESTIDRDVEVQDAAARMVRQLPSDIGVVSAVEKPFYDHQGEERIMRRLPPNAKLRGERPKESEFSPPPYNVLAPPRKDTAAALKFENRLGEEVFVRPGFDDKNKVQRQLATHTGWSKKRRGEGSRRGHNPKIPHTYDNGVVVCTPKMVQKGQCPELWSPPPPPEPPYAQTIDGFIVCGPEKIKNADCTAPSPPPDLPSLPAPSLPPAEPPPPLPAYPPTPDALTLRLAENQVRWAARKRMDRVREEEARRGVEESHLATREDVRLRKSMREHAVQHKALSKDAAEAQREAALLQARATMAALKAKNLTMGAEIEAAHLDQAREKLAPSQKEFEEVFVRDEPRGEEHETDKGAWAGEPGALAKLVRQNLTSQYYPPTWSQKWVINNYRDADAADARAAVHATARSQSEADKHVDAAISQRVDEVLSESRDTLTGQTSLPG